MQSNLPPALQRRFINSFAEKIASAIAQYNSLTPDRSLHIHVTWGARSKEQAKAFKHLGAGVGLAAYRGYYFILLLYMPGRHICGILGVELVGKKKPTGETFMASVFEENLDVDVWELPRAMDRVIEQADTENDASTQSPGV